METSLTSQSPKTNFLRRSLLLWAIIGLTGLVGCEKKQEHPDIGRLRGQLAAAEKRLGDLEVEIKTAKEDPVSAAALSEEKELLRSRIARTKEQLLRLGGTSVADPAAAGGGHH